MIDALTRHAIYLQRYAGGLFKDLRPQLRKLRDDVADRIASGTEYEQGRLSLLMADLNTIIDGSFAPLSSTIFESVDELAVYEQGYSLKLLDSSTVATVLIGAGTQPELLKAFVRNDYIRMAGETPMTIEQMIGTFNARYKRDIKTTLQAGLLEGKTIQQMTSEVKRLSNSRSRRQAEALVRTVVNHAGASARRNTFSDYNELFEGERYSATLDSRTTLLCGGYDSKIFPFDSGPIPPLHYNCLTGNTLVSSRYNISNVSRRKYEGTIYVFKTSSGNTIECTPNHPILTNRGFIGAQFINKSDKLLRDITDRSLFINIDKDNIETTIEDLFTSFSMSSGVVSRTVEVSAIDFHGDTTDNKVDIVYPNGLLPDDIIEGEKTNDLGFIIGSSYIESSLFSFGAFFKRFNIFRNTIRSNMTVFNLLPSLFGSHKRPFHRFLLRLTSKFDSLFFKFTLYLRNWYIKPFTYSSNADTVSIKGNCTFESEDIVRPNKIPVDGLPNVVFGYDPHNNFGSDVKLSSDIIDGSLGDKVLFDDIIDITIIENVSTHVYNLENELHYYTANNLITHNCRSVRVPSIKSEYDLNIDTTRAAQGGEVSARTTYSGWLRRQSKEVQNKVLGVEKAKLFRSGKVTLDRFVDSTGHTYTLKELAEADSIA